jgi:hypothetical protein
LWCPKKWIFTSFKGLGSNHLTCQKGNLQGIVDCTFEAQAFQGWIESDNPWTHDDETQNNKSFHVVTILFFVSNFRPLTWLRVSSQNARKQYKVFCQSWNYKFVFFKAKI